MNIIDKFDGNPYPSLLDPDELQEGEHWKVYWMTISRYSERIMDLKNNKKTFTSYDYDDIMSFFIHAFHLKDWILNEHEDLKKEIYSFINDNIEIQFCRDLCNGWKHKLLKDSSLSKDIRFFQGYNYGLIEKLQNKEIQENPNRLYFLFNVNEDLVKIDSFELIEKVHNLWVKFLQDNLK